MRKLKYSLEEMMREEFLKENRRQKERQNSFLLIPNACNSKISQTEWPETQQSYPVLITEA